MLASIRLGRPRSPLSWVAALLVFGGLWAMVRTATPGDEPSTAGPDCDVELDPACAVEEGPTPTPSAFTALPTVADDDVCLRAGYLCSPLQRSSSFRIRRWKDATGTLVVHVPAPSFEDGPDARRLQRAATAGIRAWNGNPFPIAVDERGTRDAHFSVRWARTVGGTRLGVAQTRWSADRGLQVVALELGTRSPYAPGRVIDPRQIRLTAAHEMGHALGLPHSDDERDVMYPVNTATALTTQDYRTMEALYDLEDGTQVVR